MVLDASEEELAAARAVMDSVRTAVRAGIRIELPRRLGAGDPATFAANAFGGAMGPFRYQFEGEDDLLHLIVCRADGSPLTAEVARVVASALFGDLSSGLVWLRPGTLSQHFYVGHDDLLASG